MQPDLQRPATTPPSQIYSSSGTEEATRKVATEHLTKIDYNTDIPRSTSLLGTRFYTVASAGFSDLGAGNTNADRTLMQDNLARVDAKKRGESSVLLMTTAQRNVQARLSGIDKQIAESRGFVQRDIRDTKPLEIAQAGSEKRMEHHRKVNIGGGLYMTPGEIDAIAEKNVQPVLDEINRGAKVERDRLEAGSARELGRQLDVEESKRVQNLQQAREKETREDIKKAKGMYYEDFFSFPISGQDLPMGYFLHQEPGLSGKCLKAVEKEEEKRRKEEEKRATKERKQLAKIDNKRRRESIGVGSVADMRGPDPPTSPKSDNSEGGIRGLINRFRRRYSRQTSLDEKNAIAGNASAEGSPTAPTFSGGHRAVMAEQQLQQQKNDPEANSRTTAVANGSTSPRPPASRIPRPVSAVIVPRSNSVTATSGNQGSIRMIATTGAPPVATRNSSTDIRRRHSLSSVGSTGHRFKGRKRGDDAALSSWAEDSGVKKGKEKVNGKTAGDFSKANGRIVNSEAEYPDEARDTFSQQPTTLNRPTSGYFLQDERRFSAGEASMSSRFRENL